MAAGRSNRSAPAPPDSSAPHRIATRAGTKPWPSTAGRSFCGSSSGTARKAPRCRVPIYGFFDNGGGRCYVVNIPPGDPLAGKGRQRSGLRLLEAIDEIAIVAAPGYTDALSYEDLLAHCELMGDRMAILDGPEQVGDVERLTRVGVSQRSAQAEEAEGEPAPAAPAEENTGLRPAAVRLRHVLRAVAGRARLRSPVRWSAPRPAVTSPGSGHAATRCAACTRRRPTSPFAARSTSPTG